MAVDPSSLATYRHLWDTKSSLFPNGLPPVLTGGYYTAAPITTPNGTPRGQRLPGMTYQQYDAIGNKVGTPILAGSPNAPNPATPATPATPTTPVTPTTPATPAVPATPALPRQPAWMANAFRPEWAGLVNGQGQLDQNGFAQWYAQRFGNTTGVTPGPI